MQLLKAVCSDTIQLVSTNIRGWSPIWIALPIVISLWSVLVSRHDQVSGLQPIIDAGPFQYTLKDGTNISDADFNERMRKALEATFTKILVEKFPNNSWISDSNRQILKSTDNFFQESFGDIRISIPYKIGIKNLGDKATSLADISFALYVPKSGGVEQILAARGIKAEMEIPAGTYKEFTPPPLHMDVPGALFTSEMLQFMLSTTPPDELHFFTSAASAMNESSREMLFNLQSGKSPYFFYLECKDIFGDVIKAQVDLWPTSRPLIDQKKNSFARLDSDLKTEILTQHVTYAFAWVTLIATALTVATSTLRSGNQRLRAALAASAICFSALNVLWIGTAIVQAILSWKLSVFTDFASAYLKPIELLRGISILATVNSLALLYFSALTFRIFKELEILCHQRFQVLAIGSTQGIKELVYRPCE